MRPIGGAKGRVDARSHRQRFEREALVTKTDEAADLLLATRRNGLVLSALPTSLQPASLADAYAVQDALVHKLGGAVLGWKVAATTSDLQRHLGVAEPICGRLLQSTVERSPARLPYDAFQAAPHLECELGFEMAETLLPRDAPFDPIRLAPAIGRVLPCLELPCFRYTAMREAGVMGIVADNCAAAFAVTGEPSTSVPVASLRSIEVTCLVNAVTVGRGSGAVVLGDPLAALTWLANHLAGRDQRLEAGSLVLTGAVTGVHRLRRGDHAVGMFGLLGNVEVIVE